MSMSRFLTAARADGHNTEIHEAVGDFVEDGCKYFTIKYATTQKDSAAGRSSRYIMGTSTRGPTQTPSAISCFPLPLPSRKATYACSNAAHRVERALVVVVHTLAGYRLLEPKC